MYNKHSVGNFGPFVSIADRAEALPEHAKRVSWPEPCLIGGGTKGPENCRECVYTWRGSFGPFAIKSQVNKVSLAIKVFLAINLNQMCKYGKVKYMTDFNYNYL